MPTPAIRLLTLLAVALAGCAAPVGPADGAPADAEDLGSVGTKDDSVSTRTVAIDLAPGGVKWFRVRATRFHAELEQEGDVPAALSAKSYDIEIDGEVAADPEIDVAAPAGEPEELRNWTLRVHNLGEANLRGVLTVTAVEELPEAGTVLREAEVSVEPFGVQRFRVAAGSIRAELTPEVELEAQLSAKHYEIDVAGEPSTRPVLEVESPGDEVRNWTLRVHNLSGEVLRGLLTVRVLEQEPETEERTGRPTLDDPVLTENDFCIYADSAPYVREIRWDDPLVQAAMRQIPPGFRSAFSYTEWRVAYGLENDRDGTDEEIGRAVARNFVRVLCGELRDYPELLRRRLEVIAAGTHYAGPGEMISVSTSENLFTQLTYPAYERMVRTMRAVHAYRQSRQPGDRDGYHYGFGAYGHGSRRVDHSVAPWTHCEMKFMFERYMTAGAPSSPDGATYESEYAAYRDTECTEDDLAWMYNFRGHVNFQPLWLESNAFVFNSRRARGAEISRRDRSYYLRPFAARHAAARSAWGTYLFYPDADHDRMIRASESGGGPILYVTDQDTDGNGLADYRLFDEDGCGDMGVGLPIPSQNCNMVSWEQAWYTRSTTGHASAWDPGWIDRPDMGFLEAFGTFEERMARFTQALDRHTNWGPTGYYMLEASDPGDQSPRFYGAYSPIVAASYDVSASDFFVRRDYPTTDPFERGRAKWLFVMKYRADDYYDEEDMAAGRPMDFERHYFNETSLSNDYYHERALDHWGYIPGEEHHAQVYLTYGHRGETPPALADVPAP